MRIPLLVLALLATLVPSASAAWRRPVSGAVARGFTYSPAAPFRAGAHRGVDFSAPVGARVRAACAGTVVTAGMAVVTVRCGAWRVTALPIASFAVTEGAHVRAGATIGRLGMLPGHTGLHLGVRRFDDRFAYVDPLPLLRAAPPPITAVPREGPRGARPPAAGRPVAPPAVAGPRAAPPPRAAPAPRGSAPPHPRGSAPRAAPAPRVFAAPRPGGVRVSAREPSGGLAPWPAWAGLALLALGAVGGGLGFRARGRVAALAEPPAERLPSAP